MTKGHKHRISLPPEHRDDAVQRWLREEVAPVYDAMKADPARGIDLDAVFAQVRARHLARSKEG